MSVELNSGQQGRTAFVRSKSAAAPLIGRGKLASFYGQAQFGAYTVGDRRCIALVLVTRNFGKLVS